MVNMNFHAKSQVISIPPKKGVPNSSTLPHCDESVPPPPPGCFWHLPLESSSV